MNQQNINRLFREKLYSYEATPSDNAWYQVSKQLNNTTRKNLYPIYWIAASLTFIATATWFFWHRHVEKSPRLLANEINYPQPEANPTQWDIPEWNTIRKPYPFPRQKSVPNKDGSTKEATLAHAPKKGNDESTPALPNETKKYHVYISNLKKQANSVMNRAEAPTIDNTKYMEEQALQEKSSTVKITYIASKSGVIKQKQDSTNSKLLKRFISFAGKVSPGDILSDFKTAKDNLINGGFKYKEKNRINL